MLTDKLKATLGAAMNEAVAHALGAVAGFAFVLEASGDLTAEKLVDYCRAMAIKIDSEAMFAESFAETLKTARDMAATLNERLPGSCMLCDDNGNDEHGRPCNVCNRALS